jgi:hypothetical protein
MLLLELVEQECRNGFCETTVLFAIAAHEAAHAMFGHRRLGAGPASCYQELIADFTAGWALARHMQSCDDAARVLGALSSDGTTHPYGESRADVLYAGHGLGHLPFDAALVARQRQLVMHAQICRNPAYWAY